MKEMYERKSTRAFTDQDIRKEDIYEMIDSARQAPSGDNTQPWRYVVIRDEATKKAIALANNQQKWLESAPVFIACLLEGSTRISDKSIYLDETTDLFELKQMIRDTTISIDHLVLKAQNLGIGTCWTAWFDQKSIKDILALPANTYVVAVIALGYPKFSNQKPRGRKPIEEIMFFEKYGE